MLLAEDNRTDGDKMKTKTPCGQKKMNYSNASVIGQTVVHDTISSERKGQHRWIRINEPVGMKKLL